MAKIQKAKRCVMCGEGNAKLWTLDNVRKVAVMYLCKEHGAPLLEIMEAAGDLPPGDQIPLPERNLPPLDKYGRGRRVVPLVALDWTPPD